MILIYVKNIYFFILCELKIQSFADLQWRDRHVGVFRSSSRAPLNRQKHGSHTALYVNKKFSNTIAILKVMKFLYKYIFYIVK